MSDARVVPDIDNAKPWGNAFAGSMSILWILLVMGGAIVIGTAKETRGARYSTYEAWNTGRLWGGAGAITLGLLLFILWLAYMAWQRESRWQTNAIMHAIKENRAEVGEPSPVAGDYDSANWKPRNAD